MRRPSRRIKTGPSHVIAVVLVSLVIFGVTSLYLHIHFELKKREGLRSGGLEFGGQDFIILPNFLPPTPRLLTILVLSSCPNYQQRRAIRELVATNVAWSANVSLYFVLGRPATRGEVLKVGKEEWDQGDIIQVNVAEKYTSLLSKVLTSFTFLHQHMSSRFYLKSDDDVFLNLPLILSKLRTNDHSYLMLGNVITKATPATNPQHKWYAKELMTLKTLPDYLSGSAYILSEDVVAKLVNCPKLIAVFPVEDLYLTGLCREHFQIPLLKDDSFSLHRVPMVPCRLLAMSSIHGLSPREITQINREVSFHKESC